MIKWTLTDTVTLAFVLAIGVVGGCLAYTTETKPIPTFKVGACVQVKDDLYEDWNKRAIWKIEMVGKRNYLMRVIPSNIYTPSPGTELSFSMAEFYHVIPCPTKGGS